MTPIVLHHGLGGMPGVKVGPFRMRYFRGIDQALAKRGHPIIQTRVHPTAGIADRAEELKEQIVSGLERIGQPDAPVLVVGHSMGGLDARYMISKLDMGSRVAALLSVTTPHRGSPVADWAAHKWAGIDTLRWISRLGLNVQAVQDLTTEACKQFNDEIQDASQVKYFSIGAARPWHRVPAFAVPAHKIITDVEGPNDSLVSVESAKWGKEIGVWPADHFHTINHRMILELRNPTGDIAPYYERAVDQVLAECALK